MDKLLLEEDSCFDDLLPFTSTRSVLDIRMGILTFREKWERLLGPDRFALIERGAAGIGSTGAASAAGVNMALPANMLPTPQLAAFLKQAMATGPMTAELASRIPMIARIIRYPWDIFHHNAEALVTDYILLTAGRKHVNMALYHELMRGLLNELSLRERGSFEAALLAALKPGDPVECLYALD